jgi:hypothetical protein
MSPISTTRWSELQHAYGAADDIPALLERARTDLRPAANSDSAWFQLWSALCHQGDAYTASYAAAPTLADIAKTRQGKAQYDALQLIALIELARLEGRAPAVPADLVQGYQDAKLEARGLIEALLATKLDDEWRVEFLAGQASLTGEAAKARTLLDAD